MGWLLLETRGGVQKQAVSAESEMHEPQSGLAEHEDADVWDSCVVLELIDEVDMNVSSSMCSSMCGGRPC